VQDLELYLQTETTSVVDAAESSNERSRVHRSRGAGEIVGHEATGLHACHYDVVPHMFYVPRTNTSPVASVKRHADTPD
jgi:hypothetical protein